MKLDIRYVDINKYMFFLLFLSASWDIFANFKIFGYSFRFFYFIELLIALMLIYRMYNNNKYILKTFPGHTYFLIWILFIFYFIPNTTVLMRNVGYFIWLLLSYILLLIFVNLIDNVDKYLKYLKLYLYSYFFMAIFGVVQFIAGLFGISLKTAQWWIPGILPRINGLNYEPSYYGTYLSGGEAFLYWLTFIEKKEIIPFQKFITLFILFVMVLSTSRLAIVAILFIISIHFYKEVLIPLSYGVIPKTGLKLIVISLSAFTAAVYYILTHIEEFYIFFSGIGLFGASSHSLRERLVATKDVLQIFLENPIIGVSLGGIPSYRAVFYNAFITTQWEAKHFEGVNVILEVMAASGIIGFLFFVMFWINAIYIHKELSKKLTRNNNLIVALTNSAGIMVLAEIFTLLFNQNILRPYLWLSIGIYMVSLRILQEEAHSIGNEKAGS